MKYLIILIMLVLLAGYASPQLDTLPNVENVEPKGHDVLLAGGGGGSVEPHEWQVDVTITDVTPLKPVSDTRIMQGEVKRTYRQFRTVSEARNYLESLDFGDIYTEFRDNFELEPVFQTGRCVGIAYAIALYEQARDDGYIFVVASNNNNTHWYNQTIIGMQIYDVEWSQRGWELRYVTWVEE